MRAKGRFTDELASSFLIAEETGVPIAPISSIHPDLAEDDAYRVQRRIVSAKVESGDKVIGWKIGATSQAIQQMLGIDEPVYGVLLQSHRATSGGKLSLSSLIHPRIECEIAFLIGRQIVGPGATSSDVLEATEAVLASLEINDPRTAEWEVGRHEVIADNGLAARFVLGEQRMEPTGLELRNAEAVLLKNGEQITKSTGEAVLGDPANAVAWLANKLAEHGQVLEAGNLVLPGSLTPIYPVEAGDKFEAIFDYLGSVSIEFE